MGAYSREGLIQRWGLIRGFTVLGQEGNVAFSTSSVTYNEMQPGKLQF